MFSSQPSYYYYHFTILSSYTRVYKIYQRNPLLSPACQRVFKERNFLGNFEVQVGRVF